MKKLFLIAVSALCILTASAQEDVTEYSSNRGYSKVAFGIRGGLNVSTLSSDYVSPTAHLGFIADFGLSRSLYIQSGLYGSVKSNGDHYGFFHATYLQIPLLMSYRYNFGNALQLQINGGVYGAYNVGDYCENCFDSFDYGVQFGAGLMFSRHYYLGLTYEHGLNNGLYCDWWDEKYNNMTFMLSLGYNF